MGFDFESLHSCIVWLCSICISNSTEIFVYNYIPPQTSAAQTGNFQTGQSGTRLARGAQTERSSHLTPQHPTASQFVPRHTQHQPYGSQTAANCGACVPIVRSAPPQVVVDAAHMHSIYCIESQPVASLVRMCGQNALALLWPHPPPGAAITEATPLLCARCTHARLALAHIEGASFRSLWRSAR